MPIDRERMTPLPPIRTVLRTRKKGAKPRRSSPSTLHARLTEIGTLDLWCSEIGGPAELAAPVRRASATQTDIAAHESQAEGEGVSSTRRLWRECQTLIEDTFGPDRQADKPEGLIKRLAAATGMSRNQWPTSLCRRMWEALMEVEPGRRRSPVHEARWLNLLGFALRPGYGLAVDDWRVPQTWTDCCKASSPRHRQCPRRRLDPLAADRRRAGGRQQQALADPLLGPIRSLHHQLTTGKGRSDFGFAIPKRPRCGGCWARWNCCRGRPKTELGGMLLDLLPKRKMEPVRSAMIWAVGRLGARVPLYGPLNAVVPADSGRPIGCRKLMPLRIGELPMESELA